MSDQGSMSGKVALVAGASKGTDVTDADSVRHLVEVALSAFGRLDATFNNASAGPMPAPLAEIDPGEFDLGIATNIRGTFLGMKFQIPAMLRSGGGAIAPHDGGLALVREVDDAEAVALGVGQHDEVRVLGELVPVDPAGAERYQARRLRLLFGRVGDVQVKVEPRMILRRCLAGL